MEIEQKQKEVIDHYVKQASSLDGSALGPLVAEVTSHPALFAFSEIIAVPNVLQLEGTEISLYLDVLRLFAHGTWSEYKSDASRLPQLVPDQVLKLKPLTVLTLAQTNKTNVDKLAHVAEYVNVLFKNGELFSAHTDALISTLKNNEEHQKSCDWTKQKQLKIQGATYVLIRDSKAETSSISIGGER